MSVRRRLKGKKIPASFASIEEVIEDFEAQMRDAVAADHAGKRKAESAWAVHRIHWEKNRFIHDLMHVRKAMDRGLYDWLVREKVADGALIAKWRKPGYEILCSMLAIQRSGHNFGATSHCRCVFSGVGVGGVGEELVRALARGWARARARTARLRCPAGWGGVGFPCTHPHISLPLFLSLSHPLSVPMKSRAPAQRIQPDVQTGCVCCASGDGRFGGPIWWNTPEAGEEEAGGGEGEGGGGTAWAPAGDYGVAPPAPPPSRKRGAPEPAGEGEGEEEEDEDLPDEVKQRLAALKR